MTNTDALKKLIEDMGEDDTFESVVITFLGSMANSLAQIADKMTGADGKGDRDEQ